MHVRFLVPGFLLFCALQGATQVIGTIAGKPGTTGYSGDGSPSGSSVLDHPWGTAADRHGNVYIADAMNHVIRKISPSGIISTFAGNGTEGFVGDGGPAAQATLNRPSALFVDPSNTLYFVDGGGTYVRKISAAGIIVTVAGTGIPGYGGDGGPALQAVIFAKDLVIDAAGNIILSENGRIRRINNSGIIETIAGNGISYPAGDGGPAMAAQVNPGGLGMDRIGNLYIAEAGSKRVRKIDVNGIISTVAGNGTNGYSGDGGPATSAQIDDPYDVVIDDQGNLYIAHHQHHVIRRVDPSGRIETFAGTGRQGYSGDGGPAIDAALTFPVSLSLDDTGNLYITDAVNHTVRKINTCLLPKLNNQPSDAVVCSGENAVYSISIQGNASYQWEMFHAGSWTDVRDNSVYSGTTTPVLTVSSVTNNMDRARFRSRIFNSCGSIHSQAVQLRVESGQMPSLSVTPTNVSVCPNGAVTFSAITAYVPQDARYQWMKNGFPMTGANSPLYTDSLLQQDDLIYCTIRFSLDCLPVTQLQSNKVRIQTKECFSGIHVPTGFTPNQDGKNDFFRPIIHEELLEYDFTVYNRWGQAVFHSKDPAKPWDGRYLGTDQPEGVFTWYCRYRIRNKPEGYEKGTVLLIR